MHLVSRQLPELSPGQAADVVVDTLLNGLGERPDTQTAVHTGRIPPPLNTLHDLPSPYVFVEPTIHIS